MSIACFESMEKLSKVAVFHLYNANISFCIALLDKAKGRNDKMCFYCNYFLFSLQLGHLQNNSYTNKSNEATVVYYSTYA